jgi:hypothetical protein
MNMPTGILPKKLENRRNNDRNIKKHMQKFHIQCQNDKREIRKPDEGRIWKLSLKALRSRDLDLEAPSLKNPTQ